MDSLTASSLERRHRLRVACLALGALLTAVVSLTALPGIAGASARRHAGHPRRGAALRHRHRIHRRRRAVAQDATVRVRRSTTRHLTVRRRKTQAGIAVVARSRCRHADVRIGEVARAEVQRAVVCLINRQRRERGLPTLRTSVRLDASAQSWTNTMVRDRAFSHGSDFAARITAVGFDWSQVGENIADGYRTPASVVTAWMHSTGHCQNILNPEYREVGTGVSTGSASAESPTGTWTQDFGLLAGQHGSDNWAPAEHCPY